MGARRVAAAIAMLAAAGAARAAEPQGIANERPQTLRGTVVELICAVAGRCAADCGGGRRQLGLRTDDGRLVATIKSPVDFAGANIDLLPYCGRVIETDGLLIDSPAAKLYLVQFIRERPEEAWKPTGAFLQWWTAKHGAASEWHRADPQAKAIIAEDGVLGVKGLEPKKP